MLRTSMSFFNRFVLWLLSKFRDSSGRMLSPAESADYIAEWWSKEYAGRQITTSTHAPHWGCLTPLIYTSFEVNRAVDMKYAPAVVWHSCARSAAEMIQSQIHHWLLRQELPQEWSTGTQCVHPQGREGNL